VLGAGGAALAGGGGEGAVLGAVTHDMVLTTNLVTALAGRTALLFALVGTIGVGAEGQLALIRELERAYSDLKETAGSLETMQQTLVRRVQDDTMLDETARAITATLDAERVLSVVMERVELLLDAEASTLMTLDTDRQELVFHILRGSSAEALRGYRLPVGKGVAGCIAVRSTSVLGNCVARCTPARSTAVLGKMRGGMPSCSAIRPRELVG